MKTLEQAQVAGIGSVAFAIAEKIGEEIICANKDKWETALQADIDATPSIKIAKHSFLQGLNGLLKEVVSLCDCPAPEQK